MENYPRALDASSAPSQPRTPVSPRHTHPTHRSRPASQGRCWFKANNASVVASPGKVSVESTSQAPPPPPPPPFPPKGATGDWQFIGPWNIGDDVDVRGESGTLADAASPRNHPNVIYTGGQNNGASSGLLKSTDMGVTWQVASHGMFVTRVDSVGIVDLDGAGAHVLCAVPGGVYETLDGAASWSLVNGSSRFGSCNTITRGHIGGRPHMLLSCSVGVVNVEIVGDGTAAASEVASCLAEAAPIP